LPLLKPIDALTAGYSWRFACVYRHAKNLLNLDYIDSPRNGLLLFTPLQIAFYHEQLCFSYDAAAGSYTAHVLDSTILQTKLTELPAFSTSLEVLYTVHITNILHSSNLTSY
jgi:hypothetical protein